MDEGLLATEFQADIDAIRRVAIVPTILDVLCRTTGMGFAAVARVTPERWIACSVRDMIAFGLEPGGELQVETTICHEIRQSGEAVVIDNVAEDRRFCDHRTPALYGFQSYISMPIILPDGQFFGTLCAIDLQPRRLSTPEIVNSFKLFAELIAFHLDAARRVAESEARLARAQELSELREQFIAVLGHDLRNPLAAVSAGMRLLTRRPERAAEIAGHMEESILRMSGLIDDVMDFARGRLGDGLTIRQDVVTPLEPVLAQIVQELRSAHPERQIDLDISLEQPIRCDPSRIGQLLSKSSCQCGGLWRPGAAGSGDGRRGGRRLRSLGRQCRGAYSAGGDGEALPALLSRRRPQQSRGARARALYRGGNRPRPWRPAQCDLNLCGDPFHIADAVRRLKQSAFAHLQAAIPPPVITL